jgi:hypothetical protein
VSRRKVVTEITIETSQVLVIRRRQVSRSWRTECGRDGESERLEDLFAPVDETGNQRGVGASSSTPHFTGAADGSRTIYPRSLQGASTLAKRFLNCLRLGSRRECETPRVESQKSKGADKT